MPEDEGLLPPYPPSRIPTPHPALCATFSHKGSRITLPLRPWPSCVEGSRIGGADAVSDQGEAGIGQAQRQRIPIVDGEGDGRLWPGAYREAPALLFQEALGDAAQGLDHQASVLVEDAIGAAVLGEGVVVAALRHLQHIGSRELASLLGGDGLVGQDRLRALRGRRRIGGKAK